MCVRDRSRFFLHCYYPYDSVYLGCRDIRNLPEGILIKILISLDKSSLRTARLVCKAFRAASIPCITFLCANFRLPNYSAIQSNVARDLGVFTSLRHQKLCMDLPTSVAVLQLDTVCSALCELHLESNLSNRLRANSWDAISACLIRASRLTTLSLKCASWEEPTTERLLTTLQGCSSLVELQLGYNVIPDTAVAQVILESIPTLRYLGCGGWSIFSEALCSNTSMMTRLEILRGIVLETDGDVQCVVALTRLTHLEVSCLEEEWQPQITQLCQLSRLQVLKMHLPDIEISDLRKVVAPMRQLRELDIKHCDADVAQLDSLLASLPAITKFWTNGSVWQMHGSTFFLPNGFASLRKFSMHPYFSDPRDVRRLCDALTRLEFLKVTCGDTQCLHLLSNLSHMSSLTGLKVSVDVWSTWRVEWPSAQFVTGVPQLRVLALYNVLDPKGWDGDVQYIAALTALTHLNLHNWRDETDKWSLTIAHVQPLTVLRHLELLKVGWPWVGGVCAPEFQEALQGVRYQMGLPPTVIHANCRP